MVSVLPSQWKLKYLTGSAYPRENYSIAIFIEDRLKSKISCRSSFVKMADDIQRMNLNSNDKWMSSPISTYLGDSLSKNKSQIGNILSMSTNYLWRCSWTLLSVNEKSVEGMKRHSFRTIKSFCWRKVSQQVEVATLGSNIRVKNKSSIKPLFPIEHSTTKTIIITVFPNSCWVFLHTTIYN